MQKGICVSLSLTENPLFCALQDVANLGQTLVDMNSSFPKKTPVGSSHLAIF